MARILIGNIKGPQGPTGPRGETGPQGPVGPQGPLPPLTNNGLATVAGISALDAVMGKTLSDKDADLQRQLNDTNSNLASFFSDVSYYTLAELAKLNYSYLIPRIGFINWNSAISPDANSAYVLYVKDCVMAISITGKIYTSSLGAAWVLKN